MTTPVKGYMFNGCDASVTHLHEVLRKAGVKHDAGKTGFIPHRDDPRKWGEILEAANEQSYPFAYFHHSEEPYVFLRFGFMPGDRVVMCADQELIAQEGIIHTKSSLEGRPVPNDNEFYFVNDAVKMPLGLDDLRNLTFKLEIPADHLLPEKDAMTAYVRALENGRKSKATELEEALIRAEGARRGY